ncbi:hypothetical protein C8R44DRAFT_882162 [Mycena epipterygia]|nr:hypothetical protein C8R44DRAFT_882162 [Mycena epipterygia]
MLTLHTTKNQHTMLYQPYPENWPVYTPRDELDDWLEHYAIFQDLVKWTVVVDRSGTQITLHPAHIVLATGTLGAPFIPSITDSDLFTGPMIHAAAYTGGKAFAGSARSWWDLAFQGAATTILQRSSTCVVSLKSGARMLAHMWPSEVPTEVADFKVEAMPFLLVREIGKVMTDMMWAEEKETHTGLREAGLSLMMRKDGSGQYPMLFERFGGGFTVFFSLTATFNMGVDVGTAKLIRRGKVKVKQGVEIARSTEHSAVFSDGSSLEIDAMIYATSYHNIRDTVRRLFGDAVIDQTVRTFYFARALNPKSYRTLTCTLAFMIIGFIRQLWYAGGYFNISRFYSKQLALEIKAIELGLLTL